MPEEEKIDLDKLRDETCFPIAQTLFREFPTSLMKDEGTQKELQLKGLSLMLDSDLNVVEEVPYISQVILGILSGLNVTIQKCGLVNDDERYENIASRVLQIVSDDINKITLGTATPEQTEKDFANVQENLINLFTAEGLSQMEVKYIMDKIFTNFAVYNNTVSSSIKSSTERMECKILGIESMSDLRLKKLNEELLK